MNLKKYFSYSLCVVFASVSYANTGIKMNDESFHKILNYSLMTAVVNSYSLDNHSDSFLCKTAARIVALKNEIIKHADPQSRDTALGMIETAQTAHKECNSKETHLSR